MSIKNNDPNVDTSLYAPQADERELDLKKENRITLGKYLSDRTKGKQSDDKLFPPRLTQYNPSTPNAFTISDTPEELILNRDVLSQLSSDQEAFVTNEDAYNKWSTKGTPVSRDVIVPAGTSNVDKHRILHSIVGKHGARDAIVPSTEEAADVSGNEASQRLRTGISAVLDDNIYTRDGTYFTKNATSGIFHDKIEKLRQDAEKALLNASGNGTVGHLINLKPSNVRTAVNGFRVDATKAVGDISFDEGTNEAGPDVDGSSFIPSNLINADGANRKIDDGLGTTGGIYTGLSYGTKNSVEVPFGNLFKSGSTILAALAAVVAIIAAVFVWSLVVSLIILKMDRPDYRTGRLPSGTERDTSFGSDILGMVFGTKRPYNVPNIVAAFRGTYLFLGISTSGADVGTIIGKAALNFAMSPDYYLLVARSVTTGLYSFINSFSAGGGGVAGAMAMLASIRTNKLVTFVNRIIDVGSVTMRGVDITDETLEKPPPDPRDASAYRDSAIRRISRSREFGNKLSWRSSSTAMKLLMPESMVRGSALINADGPNLQNVWLDRIAKRVPLAGTESAVTDKGYFEQDEIKEVEKALDAEYVPFYFRDLRTNEIISFHAFLEDLSDQFTANYTAAEGFGRQDPVQMYKSTTRAIGFSFYVVSTSPKDHDVMWYKVNKLVTMLYPQYTDGNLASNAENKNQFEVPFSQVYGASPLIRLRIGDVIASNYSRFGLSRLFGLGKKDRTFHLTDTTTDAANPNLSEESVATFRERSKSDVKGIASIADYEKSKDSKADGEFGLSSDLNPLVKSVSGRIIRGGVYTGFNSKAKGLLSSHYQVHLRPNTPVTFYPIDNTIYTQNYLNSLNMVSGNKNLAFCELVTPQKTPTNQDNSAKEPSGGESAPEKTEPETISWVLVPWELLETNDVVEVSPVIPWPPPSPPATPSASDTAKITNINNFFSKDNSIVRSFESSMGYGLAGVLTSMAMDWNESTWETDRLGSKAPIFLKITMQFAPIHDLPMGIDSQGAMVAPAYPVGDLVRQSHGISRVKPDGKYETTLGDSEPPGGHNPKNTTVDPYKKRFL